MPADAVAASGLYSGGYWAVVRELPALAERHGFTVSPMVCSAGYGLVDFSALLKPYAATFSPGCDGVATPGLRGEQRSIVLREWWSELAHCGRPARQTSPRTIEGIVRSSRSASVLIVASPAYVDAMGEDLLRAARVMHDPNRLAIISAPAGFPEELERHLVPSQAPLRAELGGALTSLHARVARDILEDAVAARPLDARALAKQFRDRVARCPRSMVPDRRSATDEEVLEFISRERLRTPQARHTRLLRLFRDGGSACEQSRFRRLFEEATI